MADLLATPSDLASLLQQSVDTATATLLLECATAVVQAACDGQRIIAVAGESWTGIGLTGSWLDLPQIPVTAVTSVTLDGTALTEGALDPTHYRLRGNRIWRTDGWQTYVGQPSDVVVVYSHGYAAGSQDLQMARSAVLSLAAGVYANPAGVKSESIDDYNVSFDQIAAALESSTHLRAALRKQYTRRGGLVRIG